jgi:hypothetical protein
VHHIGEAGGEKSEHGCGVKKGAHRSVFPRLRGQRLFARFWRDGPQFDRSCPAGALRGFGASRGAARERKQAL